MARPPLLRLTGVTKTYGATIANDAVDFEVAEGGVTAVLGENGAGKSTLMKIIYGAVRPDAGRIEWNGETVEIASPAQARALGVGMVFQHFSLFETLTVAENVSLALPGSIRDLTARIAAAAARFGLEVDPSARVHRLSVGERQRVEILRCILQEPRLIIMDEPTSVLPPQGIETLFETLRSLAAEGIGVIFISHKLEEIRSLCDSATIMRGGRVVGVVDPRAETAESLTQLMIGQEVAAPRPRAAARAEGDALTVAGLSHRPADLYATALDDIRLTVRRGEILGIAGVSGNGQEALTKALAGEIRAAEDAIRLDGRPIGALGPLGRRKRGLHAIPEERLGRGAVPGHSLAENAGLTTHHRGLVRFGFLDRAARRRRAEETIAAMDVRCGGPGAPARSLSGGNLQKFIVGRELAMAPTVLIASQPTWGVDVGAAAAIRQRLMDMRDAGVALLIVSEELDELMQLSDRLQVMFRGRLSPPVAAAEAGVERIGLAMAGDFAALEPAHV